jgi:hypothetical protein
LNDPSPYLFVIGLGAVIVGVNAGFNSTSVNPAVCNSAKVNPAVFNYAAVNKSVFNSAKVNPDVFNSATE